MDAIELTYSNATNPIANNLDHLAFNDLETVKVRLDTVRRRIVKLQNAQSFLFRLPGELRDQIFLLSMKAELEDRKARSRYTIMFREPALLGTSQQVRNECLGVWYSDLAIWEEFDVATETWSVLQAEDIRAMVTAKSDVGRLSIVTQQAHCNLTRTREGVEASRSVYVRKGLVRANVGIVLPQMRWWI